MQKKIYIIAGENSGDFIGANIIKALELENIDFTGIGGLKMGQAGLNSLFDISAINIMGFFEIIPKIWQIKKLIDKTVEHVSKIKPDILITIDSPGFTYRVASKVKRINNKIKLIHIVAPSVWAYKPSRAKKYAKIYDHLLCLLPFEPPYFIAQSLKASYIGHPILQQHFYSSIEEKLESKKIFNFEQNHKIICITPGSRENEIHYHMPVIIKAIELIAKKYKDIKLIFAIAQSSHQLIIKSYLQKTNYDHIYTTQRLRAYSAADLAIAKSGTNTLEIAASNTPLIVIYKLNYLTYLLARCLIKIPFISIINIVKNKLIIPELIQSDCESEKIAHMAIKYLAKPELTDKQVREAGATIAALKTTSEPAVEAAKIILQYLQ